MRKVGFGVIGCGVISTAYLKAAQRFANLELRAVSDMRGAAAEKQAAAFGVPAMRVKQDVIPGLLSPVWFTPTRIGRYDIQCSQLCGLGHYNMKAYLSVLSQDDFDKWLKQKASEQ